jgi:hypothetical protein
MFAQKPSMSRSLRSYPNGFVLRMRISHVSGEVLRGLQFTRDEEQAKVDVRHDRRSEHHRPAKSFVHSKRKEDKVEPCGDTEVSLIGERKWSAADPAEVVAHREEVRDVGGDLTVAARTNAPGTLADVPILKQMVENLERDVRRRVTQVTFLLALNIVRGWAVTFGATIEPFE